MRLTLFFLSLIVLGGTGLHAQVNYSELANVPLKVKLQQGERPVDRILLGITTENQLEFAVPGQTGPNDPRFFIPMDSLTGVTIAYPYPEEYAQARQRARDGKIDEALELLRPVAYPLIKYFDLPESVMNARDPVRVLLSMLVDAGANDEAFSIARRLPIRLLNQDDFELFLRVANNLIMAGNTSDGISLVSLIPLSDRVEAMYPVLMRFARGLRLEDKIEEALFVYKRLHDVGGHPLHRVATLWTAYCNVRLKRVESADLYLGLLPDFEAGSPEFALEKLIRARIHLNFDRLDEAMRESSQGVVYSNVSWDWKPELLYVTGLGYEERGEIKVARSVYEELNVFYEDNPWAVRASERKQNLPDVDRIEKELAESTKEILSSIQQEESEEYRKEQALRVFGTSE